MIVLYDLFLTLFHEVLPSSMLLFASGESEEHGQGSRIIYLQEDSVTAITCKSIGSLPATELSWRLNNKILPSNISLLKYHSGLDGSLFDTESTIKIHPERKHHGIHLQCFASLGKSLSLRKAKLMVYGEFMFFNMRVFNLD